MQFLCRCSVIHHPQRGYHIWLVAGLSIGRRSGISFPVIIADSVSQPRVFAGLTGALVFVTRNEARPDLKILDPTIARSLALL